MAQLKEYKGVPALSREDNATLICPDCGTREALEFIWVSAEEQEKIISIIHSHYPERDSYHKIYTFF